MTIAYQQYRIQVTPRARTVPNMFHLSFATRLVHLNHLIHHDQAKNETNTDKLFPRSTKINPNPVNKKGNTGSSA